MPPLFHERRPAAGDPEGLLFLSVDLGGAPLPRVVGDADLLARAVVNLVDNAIK